MFSFFKTKKEKMNWNQLSSESQIEEIKKESENHPVLIFKHSTTCPISSTALNRMERNYKQEEVNDLKVYYLDLLSNRGLSNAVAMAFNVEHESPQVILVKNGQSVYTESHFGISFEDLKTAL